MSLQTLREFIARHSASAVGLAALGATLEAHATGTPLEPALAARAKELLELLGATELLEGVSAQEAIPVLAELRFSLGLDQKLLHAKKRSAAWSHPEPEILQAGGDTSAGFAQGLTRAVVPALDGLGERLGKPGAAFLDVGVGVAGLAIAMARLLPELRIVGIDAWAPSLALARENVSQAGLTERIELREQRVEALDDEAAFDLAWIPTPFLSQQAVEAGCRRALRALRPGGWLLVARVNPGDDPLTAAIVRLRTTLWGGPLYEPGKLEALLGESGFADVRALPIQPGAVAALVVGRRATGA